MPVRGRKSGAWRTVPVNLLDVDGVRYLVRAARETEWVRNLRASGTGELRLAARRETFSATELRRRRQTADPARLPREWCSR